MVIHVDHMDRFSWFQLASAGLGAIVGIWGILTLLIRVWEYLWYEIRTRVTAFRVSHRKATEMPLMRSQEVVLSEEELENSVEFTKDELLLYGKLLDYMNMRLRTTRMRSAAPFAASAAKGMG